MINTKTPIVEIKANNIPNMITGHNIAFIEHQNYTLYETNVFITQTLQGREPVVLYW